MAPVPGDSSKTPAWHVDAARGPSTPSLDHLVGAAEQRQRDCKAEDLGGDQIDDQLDFYRLLDRQVGWLLALEEAANIDATQAIGIDIARPVAHQPPGVGEFARGVDRGDRMVRCQGGELLAPVAEQCVSVNDQRVCALLDERRKGGIDLLRVARTYDMKLKPELTRCVLRLSRVQLCIWIGRIHEQTYDRGVGYRFAHHLQSDCPRGRAEEAHAGHIAIWSAEASDEPELDRIAADAKDNRDRRGRRLHHHRRNVVARVDHGHWLADEIGGQRHQAVILVFSVLVFDRDVAALDKAHAAKALAKPSLHLRGGRTRAAAQIPDHRHWLPLRARRDRPRRRRAAEQRDELATPHSITSSAMASKRSGMVRPNALAVLS